MLLTLDIGNTSTKLGVYENDVQIAFSCIDGHIDDYRTLILSFIFKSNLRKDNIEKAVLSCVVSEVYDKVYDTLEKLVGKKNIIDINYKKNYGIILDMPNPEECGDDLIVMCAYAYRLYHRELLIVSMGTCSVICHVNKHGSFKHCIIAPGFKIVCDTLWKNASMINESIPEYKESYFANNTKDAISVGTYKGYVNMLESLIKGIKDELDEEPYIIGCGGMGKLLVPYIDLFNEFNPDFVTEGLRYIGDRYGND